MMVYLAYSNARLLPEALSTTHSGQTCMARAGTTRIIALNMQTDF